jgi:tetratricopeptide (TPR) repeat protein
MVMVTLLAACSANTRHASAPADDPSVVPSGAHPPVYVVQAKLCARAHACRDSYLQADDDSFEDIFGESPDECEPMFARDKVSDDDFAASVAAHRVRYDPDKLAPCMHLGDVDAMSCEQVFAVDYVDATDTCKAALVGTVAAGGACTIDWDCSAGTTCRDGACANAAAGAAADEATQHFLNGRRQYDLGNYDAAVSEFQAAYESKPDPVFLFNLGQAYRLGGHCDDARAAYQHFIDTVDDADQKAKAQEMLETC